MTKVLWQSLETKVQGGVINTIPARANLSCHSHCTTLPRVFVLGMNYGTTDYFGAFAKSNTAKPPMGDLLALTAFAIFLPAMRL
jgi:hypothetical protein